MSAVSDAARNPRAVWGSKRAYLFATIAGIVGLGNLWRFPYMVGRHGGGSFLVAYVVCVVVVAVPLGALESAAGNIVRRSPVGGFRFAAGRGGAVVGWMVVAMTAAILSYYMVITGWTLGYAVDAVGGQLRPFASFAEGYISFWLFLVVGIGVLVVLMSGVAAIEKVSLVLVPVLVVIVVGLAIYAQSLSGAGEARSFLFSLDGGLLADTATWRAAAGQAFYSIGVGQGVLIAYGSFVPAGTNLLRSTAIVAATNAMVSIVAGIMVLAVVFTFDIAPTAGSELAFTAFPRVFAEVPAGAVLAVAFFALLLVAGFSSCLGLALVVVSAVREEFRINRRVAAVVTMAAVMVLGVPSALSFTDFGLTIGGEPVLDRVDQATGSGAIVVLGLLGAAVLARALPRRQLSAAFGADSRRFGPLTLGPVTVIRWAIYLPVVAALLYGLGQIA